MLTYAIKRVLLIIPTFFAISLIVFVLVNIGAGDPGSQQSGAEGTQDADKEGNQESYRIFKEQFGLDKPIVFNTRFSLTTDDITNSLRDALNLNNTTPIERRIAAQEEMDDWGKYAVPGLMDCLTQCDDQRLRAKSSQHLAINAQSRLLTGYTETTLKPAEIERQKGRK